MKIVKSCMFCCFGENSSFKISYLKRVAQMPQEFHVLQCYSCNVFQVDIVKKVPKWSCKMCGEKQSIKNVYFKGSGKECRLRVQELNEKRIRLESSVFDQVAYNSFLETVKREEQITVSNKEKSKWSKFMPNIETNEEKSCVGVESDNAAGSQDGISFFLKIN